MTKDKNKEKINWLGVGLTALIVTTYTFGIYSLGKMDSDCVGCGCGLAVISYIELEEQLDLIKERCHVGEYDMIHLSKTEEGYRISVRECIQGGYCDYKYYKLDECLSTP